MTQKIRVGAVSYLNTKPLIYGFEQGEMKDEIDLVINYPSKIASMLIHDEVDIGLVPVAIIPTLKEHHIISDYCIGCNGEVASVCLFSEVPLFEIETILLDYQSRTSVALLKILLEEHWKMSPALIGGTADYENDITGTTAGLVIGDRALVQRQKSRYMYDLGAAWKELTGLPFVFAAWVSNKKMPEKFIQAFNHANLQGFLHLEAVIAQNPFAAFDLEKYYNENIKFKLDNDKFKAIDLFLHQLQRHAETVP